MKRIFCILFVFFVAITCSKYDDAAIKEDVNALKSRVEALETLCTQLNANISAIQAIAEGLQSGKYLTAVAPVVESGVTVGYRLTYNTGTPIVLYTGTDGTDGTDGKTGKEGAPGDKGPDGVVPSIAITLHEGRHCWSINGELLRDADGNPIAAVGQDGTAGSAAVTPQLRINSATRKWEVSYDAAGTEWIALGDADGSSATDFFKSIDNSDAHFLVVTFDDDSQIKIPKTLPISITTSQNSVMMSPGASMDIDYTLSGEFASAQIETIVSVKGWQAAVTATDVKTGKITITAPDSESSGEVLIIVYDEMVSTTIHKIFVTSAYLVAHWKFDGNADDASGTV